MNKAARTLTIALIGISGALPAFAVTLPPGAASMLAPGTLVRWTARPDSTITRMGKVITLSGDALVVAPVTSENITSHTLAIPELMSLEVSKPTSLAGRYALAGGLAGAFLVVILVHAADDASEDLATSFGEPVERKSAGDYVAPALGGALVGALAGALIGSNIKGQDRWRPVATVTALRMDGGIHPAVALGVRF